MKKGDYCILSVLIIFFVLSVYLTNPLKEASDNLKAIVRLNGEIHSIYKLTDNYKKNVEIKSNLGYNILEIDCKKLRITDSDCKDKLEVKQGYISSAGQSLVCLPHKLIITIEGDTDIDYVSY